MLLALLFILGLVFGSFLDALTMRLHAGQDWLRGRSQCDACGHKLAALDLIPLLSWLFLRGRCRYCHQPISAGHSIIELAGGVVFAASYLFWPSGLSDPGQPLLFAGWLVVAVGLMALAVYDLRWMLLPNNILYPTLFIAAVVRLGYILAYQADKKHAFLGWLAGVVVASGLFWLLFMASRGRAIGYGDVRLGLISGTLLVDPAKGFFMIFIASLLGSLFAFTLIVRGQSTFRSRIPYGPFLITATWLVLLFGQSVIDWYNRVFLG